MKGHAHAKAVRSIGILCGLAAWALPGIAQADQVSLVVPASPPPEDAAFPLAATGTNTEGSSLQLRVAARRAGGAPCAPTPGDDPGDTVLSETVDVGAFEVPGSYTPAAAGDYLLCAWLEDFGTVYAGPVSATVPVRAPNLSTTIAAPRRVRPGSSFKVTVAYGAEVPRYLTVVFAQAADCGLSPSALRTASANATDVFGATEVSGSGTVSKLATAPAARGGYLVCSFLQEDPYSSTDVAELVRGQEVRVGTAARLRRCGDVGGRRRITKVRALRIACPRAREIARRWGRARPAPRVVAGLRCRARRGSVTCAGHRKRVTFRHR